MRKKVWKRFLATALAAAMVFTSVDYSSLTVHAEESTTSNLKTLGEVLADHYESSIGGDAAATLKYAGLKINETVYDLSAPSELSNSVGEINVATKSFKAEPFDTTTGVVWNATQAEVKYVDSEEPELLTKPLDNVFTYTGEGIVEKVVVTYEASIVIKEDTQKESFEVPGYLENSADVADILWDAKDDITYWIGYLPALKDEIDQLFMANEKGLIPTEFKDNMENLKEETGDALEFIADAQFGEFLKEDAALDSDVEMAQYYDKYSEEIILLVWDYYDKVDKVLDSSELSKLSGKFKELAESNPEYSLLGEYAKNIDSYIVAYKEFAEFIDDEDLRYDYVKDEYSIWCGRFKENSEVTEVDKDIRFRAAENIDAYATSIPQNVTATAERTADSRLINLNIYAEVVGEDNIIDTKKYEGVKVTVGKEEAEVFANADVLSTIEEKLSELAEYGLTEREEGKDILNLKHYICETSIEDTDVFKVFYKPNTYKVTCADDNSIGGDYSYGYEIKLPKYTDDNVYAFEYNDGTKTYSQGESYKVTGNVTITRTKVIAETKKTTNQIVADTYLADDSSSNEYKILYSTSVKYAKSYNTRIPNDSLGLVTIDGNHNVTASAYDDQNGNVWNVLAADVMKDEETKYELGNTFPVEIPEEFQKDYTAVRMTYGLDTGLNKSDVLNVLNIPSDLAEDAKCQLYYTDKMVSNRESFMQLNATLIEMAASLLEKHAEKSTTSNEDKEQALKLAAEFRNLEFDRDDLRLWALLKNYGYSSWNAEQPKESTPNNTAVRLAKYYAHRSEIKEAYDNLVETLNNIVGEDNKNIAFLKTVLGSLITDTSVIDEIPKAQQTIAGLSQNNKFLLEINSKITDANDTNLVGAIAGLLDVDKVFTDNEEITVIAKQFEGVDLEGNLHWKTKFNVKAADSFSVKYIVERYAVDENGQYTLSATENMEIGAKKETPLTEDQVNSLDIFADATKTKLLGANKDYYDSKVEGTPVKEGHSTDSTVTFRYYPKEYVVSVPGTSDQTMYYGNMKITLPAPTSADTKYTYTIGTTPVSLETGDKDSTYPITNNAEIDALFGIGNTYTVTRTVTSVSEENKKTLFSDINDEFFASGLQLPAVDGSKPGLSVAMIPYTTNGGISTVALRVSDAEKDSDLNNIMNALMSMFEAMAKEGCSEIKMGGHVVFANSTVDMQALINALLESGIGTTDILNMYGANGTINNNLTVGLEPVALQTQLEYELNSEEALGAKVIKTTLATNSFAELDFYISYRDLSVAKSDKAEREKTVSDLTKLDSVAEIKGDENGKLNIIIKDTSASKEVYEEYLMTMIIEGRTDFNNVNNVKLKDIVEVEYDRTVPVLKGEDVTATTLLNTLKKRGKGDVSTDKFETILDLVKSDALQIDRDSDENNNAGDNEYYMSGHADATALVEQIKPAYVDFVKEGELNVPIRLQADGLDTDYAALLINDPKLLENLANGDKMVETAISAMALLEESQLDIISKVPNSIVIMLKDVEGLTFNSKAILDIHGHKVGNVENGSGTVVLVDSSYENTGSAVAGNNVKDARIDQTAATTDDFYKIVETKDDAGNLTGLTVKLDPDFLAKAAEIQIAELKTVALEIAFDIIMNNISSGDMNVTNADGSVFDLYDVDVVDDIFVFLNNEEGTTGIVNDVIDAVHLGNTEEPGLVAFVNHILDALTKVDVSKDENAFEELAAAAQAKKPVISYNVVTNPLKVNLAVAGNGKENYLTAGIVTDYTEGISKAFDIDFVVDPDKDATELVALSNAVADIVDICDLGVGLKNIDYMGNGEVAAMGAALSAHIEMDLSHNHDYAAAFAIIAALGADDPSGLVKAVNTYLADGSVADLKSEVNKITTAQLIAAVKVANTTTFDKAAQELGVVYDESVDELESVYDDLLRVVYRMASLLTNTLGISGNASALKGIMSEESREDGYTYTIYGGDYNGSHYADVDIKDYGLSADTTVNAELKLTLFKEKTSNDPVQPENPAQPEEPKQPSGDPDKDSDKDSDKELEGVYHPTTTTPAGSTGTQTGDASNLTLWISLMGIAAVALIAAVVIKKRKATK